MTSFARLAMSLIVSGLALITGWTLAKPAPLEQTSRSTRSLEVSPILAASDVDAYVNDIIASNLFPNARTRDQLSADGEETSADDLASALGDPNLSALISIDGEWQILLYGDYEGSVTRKIGDQLSDGWSITSIEPTVVMLTKDNDQREIRVFELEPSLDED